MTRIVSFIRGPKASSRCALSARTRFMKKPRCFRYTNTMNKRATRTPLPVPRALPIAPRIACGVAPIPAAVRIRRIAAPILTTAFAICSRICETDVCSMDWLAWKYPRRTPSMPNRNTVGAKTCSTGTLLGGTSAPAPKYRRRLPAIPTASAYTIEQWNTFCAFL